MSQQKYNAEFHPGFFDTLDRVEDRMTEEEFDVFYNLFEHERKTLEKNPYNNSRECVYGILRDNEFRTMTFHSKLPRIGTGDMRIIFKVDEITKTVLYYAIGKRINKRPRPEDDIYSVATSMLEEEQEDKK